MELKHSFQVVVFSIFFAIAGLALIPRLHVQYLPSGDSQYLRINYAGYGLSAEYLEREVCVPLESAISSLRGVKEIRSKTSDGSGSVDVELSRFVDLEFFRFDLSSKIRQLYSNFPEGVSYPILEVVLDAEDDQYQEPILIYSISAPRSLTFLANYAIETIAPEIGRQDGVSEVRISGNRQKRIQIDLDQTTLDQYGIDVPSIRQAVRVAYANQSIGLSRLANQTTMTVRKQGNLLHDTTNILNQLRNIRLLTSNQSGVTMENLSDIYWKDEEVSSYYRINGQNALRLLIFPAPGANHIQLAGDLQTVIADLQTNLKGEIQFNLESDNTAYLKEELSKIYKRTAWSLAILLAFIVLFYWSWKPLVIIFSGILVNLGIAFIFYYFLRVELNLYALAGITVTFGIILDNSIVMIQHIRTNQNRRVFMALLAATLTTIAALIIIFFLPENLKVQLRYFALVIIINLAVSLLVSLIYVPSLMQQMNYHRSDGKVYRFFPWWDRFYSRYLRLTQMKKTWWVLFFILLFGLPVYLLPNHWSGQEWYNKTIGSTWYRDKGRPVVNKILGGTSRLFVYYAYEHGGFRDQEETELTIHCRMPEGSSLEQTNRLIGYLESYLSNFMTHIKSFTTSITNGENARISILFEKNAPFSFPYMLKERMVFFCSQFGGAKWNVTGVGQGYSNASYASPPTFSVRFMGYDRHKIAEYSAVLKSKLERHPRVQNVETNASLSWFGGVKNVYEMNINLSNMQSAGLQLQDMRNVMNYYNLRDELLLHQPGLPQIDYSVRYKNAGRWLLENKPVLYRGRQIKVNDLVSYSKNQVTESIVKKNQEYVESVKFEYTGSNRFGEKFLDEVVAEMELELPLGFRLEKKEFSYFSLLEDSKNYGLILLIIGLIFIISAIHFESFRWPFVIIATIPLSYIGIFLIFYLTGASFDQGGYTSFIMVTGITVNSLIYLMSDYKQLLNEGSDRMEAYQKAFEQKILPIFLTLLSTIVGLLPFVLIGQNDVFWSSLAVGSIGGLLFSFVVLVFLAPVMLDLKSEKIY